MLDAKYCLQSVAVATIEEWLEDSAIGANQTVLLVAALIYCSEGSQIEALKTCHKGYSLELYDSPPLPLHSLVYLLC